MAAGVRLVGDTGRSLSRTVEQVGQLQTLLDQIASAAEQEATALSGINSSMSEMDNVTQRNAAMVQETSATVQTLSGEAEQLVTHVSRFKIEAAIQTPSGDGRPSRRLGQRVTETARSSLALAEG